MKLDVDDEGDCDDTALLEDSVTGALGARGVGANESLKMGLGLVGRIGLVLDFLLSLIKFLICLFTSSADGLFFCLRRDSSAAGRTRAGGGD